MINCSDTSGPGFQTSSSKGGPGIFLSVINIAPNSLVIVLMSWALQKRMVSLTYCLTQILAEETFVICLPLTYIRKCCLENVSVVTSEIICYGIMGTTTIDVFWIFAPLVYPLPFINNIYLLTKHKRSALLPGESGKRN